VGKQIGFGQLGGSGDPAEDLLLDRYLYST
jgi:hypothetical protein